MPDVLWPIFQKNRHLLHDLPTLGAAVIRQWAKLKYGVRVPIMVILHSFGARLNFNPHLHILVSAGGLQESEGRWVNSLIFDEDKGKLMHMWRFALLGQQKRSRPRRLSWAFSRGRDFGVDPLIDRRGQPMRWVGRLKPRV
jgi:hypothetical protein